MPNIKIISSAKLTGLDGIVDDMYEGMVRAQTAYGVQPIAWSELGQFVAKGRVPEAQDRVAVVDLDQLGNEEALEIADWVVGNIA